jgi:hypothetical protein
MKTHAEHLVIPVADHSWLVLFIPAPRKMMKKM